VIVIHIALINNHGIPYLQVMENYSIIENGKTKYKKRPVKNLGPLSRFNDGQPNFLNRLRESFKKGNPIIDGLDDLLGGLEQDVVIKISRLDVDACALQPKNIGFFVLDSLYDSLGVYDALVQYKSDSKIKYDLNGLAKLLVFGRVLEPHSKQGTFQRRNGYLFNVCRSDSLVEVYRALDLLNVNTDAIQRRMNFKIKNTIGRSTELCFYDVTNYYFEIGLNDSDILDDNGNVLSMGLRKKGVSKQKRSKPIVQMGLFIDNNGIPMAYRLFPGNENDQKTLRPALEKTIDEMKLGRVIVVADGGLNGGANIAALLDRGNGYIVAKSVNKSDKEVKRWILDESGYAWNKDGTFKSKSMVRSRKIKDAQGNTRQITEKLVCFWSKKHYERECHESEKLIKQLEAVVADPSKLTLKNQQKKIGKFLVEQQVDKNTGEILDAQKHISIDPAKVKEYLDLMGYYTIMTSEITKDDREIISKYRGLSRIEDSFRITKSNLEGRPVFVRTPEHIQAHFLICFIALTMIRLIQYRILKYLGKDTIGEDGWESGLSARRIQEALADWEADVLPGGYCRLCKPSEDLKLIFDAFGVNGDIRLPSLKDLRQLKYAFDKADWS